MLGAVMRRIEPSMQGTGSKTALALLLEPRKFRPPRLQPLERLIGIGDAVLRLEMIAYQEHDMRQLVPSLKAMIGARRRGERVGGQPYIQPSINHQHIDFLKDSSSSASKPHSRRSPKTRQRYCENGADHSIEATSCIMT